MSQQQLADAAQLSPDMISRIETGGTGVRFPSIERIADALKVDPAELFSTTATAHRDMRAALLDLTATLSKLSDDDLAWASDLMHAALRTKPQRTRISSS